MGKVSFRVWLLVCAVLVGVANVGPAGAQVREGSLEYDLFNSVRNKDMNGVRAALNAGADVFATDIMGNRAADVAVDLGEFDIAHYLLAAMDQRRQAKKDDAQQAVKLKKPPAPTPAPASKPKVAAISPAPSTSPAPSVASPPVVQGPNPFAVTTAPSSPVATPAPPQTPQVVSLSKPHLRMAGAKPSAPAQPQVAAVPKATQKPAPKPASKAAPLTTPVSEPQSTLYVRPGSVSKSESTPKTAPEPMPEPTVQPAAEPAPAPAAAPTSVPTPTPVPAPVAQPVADEEQGWFSRMTSFFSDDDEPQATPETPPAEVAAIATPAQPSRTQVPVPAPTESPAFKQPSAAAVSAGPLHLTAALALGKAPPPKPESKASSMRVPDEWPCVVKGRWGTVCLERVQWPDNLRPHFEGLSSHLYRGSKVVVGYEDGRADFLYAVFRSSGFKDVVAAFTQRLGPPNLVSTRPIKPFQKRLEVNPVRTWYGYDKQAGREMVLEITMFEDQTSTFPVMDEGSVKLTYVGEDSVFRYLSPMELQRFN